MDASRYFLHVCGGVSRVEFLNTGKSIFSPRMWRCFQHLFSMIPRANIFSTYVEVFLLCLRCSLLYEDFLHVCGGVSKEIFVQGTAEEFSPRMWRCFFKAGYSRSITKIFSTYVEVFLILALPSIDTLHFLHVCGGVSVCSF